MKLRLLIVDDNVADRALIGRLLEKGDLNAEMVELENAREFLDVSMHGFDCVLLDYRLPDRDGIDLLTMMRETQDQPSRPVIIMSGQGDEKIAARAIKAGASDYMVKDSITPVGLARAIRNSIEMWRLNEQVRSDWEAQKRALMMAERANWAKTQFLSNMSHELRTPLTAILGFSELIQTAAIGNDGKAWERYQEYAGDIRRSARHLLDLISDILDVARIESGASRLQVAEFDPRETVAEIIDMMGIEVRKHGLELAVDMEDAPAQMITDNRAVKTIVINLLSNAIKYSRSGGHIRLALREQPDGTSRLTIADTGIGMDPAELPRLMRPFERYEDSFATQTGGLGIGLSLVNSLVQLLKGRITFDTAPGLGTTATVVVPTVAEVGVEADPVN